jgi:hypothetical protein
MDFKNVKADRDGGFPRKILETDKCDWCQDKKAIITDGTYVYCSEDCKKLFIHDVYEAIEDASQFNFNKE